MKKVHTLLFLFAVIHLHAQQKIMLPVPKFSTGDNVAWKDPSFNDANWAGIKTKQLWEEQGYDYNGYAWYRFHFMLPASLKEKSFLKDTLGFFLAKIDDADETFLNGVLIGKTGSLPNDKEGYKGDYLKTREYHVATNSPALQWDRENVLAVRVYDGGGSGGMYGSAPFVRMMDIIDGISIDDGQPFQFISSGVTKDILIRNALEISVKGSLSIKIADNVNNKIVQHSQQSVTLKANENQTFSINAPDREGIIATYTFTEISTRKTISENDAIPYILTPAPTAYPKINTAKIFGVRPGSPILFKIAAAGRAPLKYGVSNLPDGLEVDESTGIITGRLSVEGEYKMQLLVSNSLGKNERQLTVRVGNLIALTPPMGWNSWNCWGLSVSEDKVKSSAQALIDKGLISHGWTYINIDDGWENPQRAADGSIVPNQKFPDMKSLGDWLHANGLKFGIYSSPGTLTCGGYTASYKHEMQDAASYMGWGVDYLKYDWCSYDDVFKKEGDTTLAAYEKPYKVMQLALRAQPRDIHYSLCQYGMQDVWKWGSEVDGNSWRTTGDITDTWQSLSAIGFSQDKLYSYAQQGRWNDPDMLIVGQLGWGDQLHPTGLTPDEQYTHISLWCLLSAPLLIGCDLSKLDDFTLNLLTNDEVLAVDQDPLGKQAKRVFLLNESQVWMKDLNDGSNAIGIFNLSDSYQTIAFKWSDIGLQGNYKVRDLWRQKDLGTFKGGFFAKVAPHGVKLIKISR